MEKVLITGGTGLIGRHLSRLLINKGYEVIMLSRKEGMKYGIKCFRWNVKKNQIDTAAFHGVNHVIHLAGAGVADRRWTRAYKQEIYDSRVLSTRLLLQSIQQLPVKPSSFICAGGISFYGIHSIGMVNENEPPLANDFLARLSMDWESEAFEFEQPGIRTVVLRTGIVLSKEGGFIPEVAKPMKFFAGAPLGSGKQYVSWIHINDLCGIYLKAIADNRMRGVYNAVAPQPVTNKKITTEIGRRLHRPVWLPPVPAFVLRILVGEIAEILVSGAQVSSRKIEQAGYRFLFPSLDSALNDLL